MLRKILFNIHWLIGISIGIALAIMGVTGAIMVFEDEILDALNGHPARVAVSGSALSLDELVAQIRASNPQQSLSSLTIYNEPTRAVQVEFARAGGARPRPGEAQSETLANPYTGAVYTMTLSKGVAFMGAVEQLHRRLTLTSEQGGQGGPQASPSAGAGGPGAPGGARPFSLGEQATSYSVLALMIMALSGLYLRWPRRKASDWRSWFRINFKLKGYAFNYNLHAVIGTVVFLGYLMSAHSGLMMSEIDWYKEGVNKLAGVQARGPGGPGEAAAVSNDAVYPLTTLWQAFQREAPTYQQATLQFGQSTATDFKITYLTHAAVTDEGGRDTNTLVLDAQSGAVKSHELFSDQAAMQRLVTRNFDFHSGSFFGLPGRIFILCTSLMMPVLLITGWMQYLARRKQKRQRALT